MANKYLRWILIAASLVLVVFVYIQFKGAQVQKGNPLRVIPNDAMCVMECSDISKWDNEGTWLNGIASNGQVIDGVPMNPLAWWPNCLSGMDSARAVNETWAEILNETPIYFFSGNGLRGDRFAVVIPIEESKQNIIEQNLITNAIQWGSASLKMHVFESCLVLTSHETVLEAVQIALESEDQSISKSLFVLARSTSSSDQCLRLFGRKESRWLELDAQFSDTRQLLSGYIHAADSNQYALSLLSAEGSFQAASVLPSSVIAMDSWSYADFQGGWDAANNAKVDNQSEEYWIQAWSDWGDSCACDLNEALLNWRGSEWGTAALSFTDSTEAYIGFIQTTASAIGALTTLLQDTISPDRIYTLKFPDVFNRNALHTFPVTAEYVTQVGDYLIYGDQRNVLLDIRNRAASGQVLSSDVNYKSALANAAPEGGRWMYRAKDAALDLPEAFLRMMEGAWLAVHYGAFSEQQALVKLVSKFSTEQITPTHTSTAEATSSSEPGALWTAGLDGEMEGGPWVVVNHNTQRKEVLIQDAKHQLVLISSDGKVLWRHTLSSAILGEVQQIDILKNGKLQYVFATAQSIECIDRNGNKVSGFPIALAKPAAAPLFVFDYDKNKTYRFVISTSDGKVMNYSTDGKATPGWQYAASSDVLKALQHLRLGGDDYLIGAMASGKVVVLKRNGQSRYESKARLKDYNGGVIYVNASGNVEAGTIDYITSGGQWSRIKLNSSEVKSMATLNSPVKYVFHDINGDAKSDLIVAHGKKLGMYDFGGSLLSETTTSQNAISAPKATRLNKVDWKVGVHAGECYLISPEGKSVEGFPMAGVQSAVYADMDGDGKNELIIVAGTSVTARSL